MKKDSIVEFFGGYPPLVEIAASLRSTIRSTIPDATETLDVPGRVVGYGVGPGYSGRRAAQPK